jgi:hypothetical protein
VVANGYAGLTSGTLLHAINLTEKRTASPVGTTNCAGGGHATVWTDTFNTGAQFLPGMNYHCSNWTDGGGATGSEWGDGNDPTQWSAWCNGGICSWTSSIYCIEQ